MAIKLLQLSRLETSGRETIAETERPLVAIYMPPLLSLILIAGRYVCVSCSMWSMASQWTFSHLKKSFPANVTITRSATSSRNRFLVVTGMEINETDQLFSSKLSAFTMICSFWWLQPWLMSVTIHAPIPMYDALVSCIIFMCCLDYKRHTINSSWVESWY